MSYVLVVWEQPMPRSMDEVKQLTRTLRADHSMVSSPNVDVFMARLWEAYPRDLDGDDADYVWDDSFPAEPQPRPQLVYLSISFSHIDEVMPFVLSTARETGLAVYDSEAGTVFLPTGEFLGNPPLPSKPPAHKTFDVRATQQELLDQLATAFVPLGFKWKNIRTWDSRFVREFEGGWQSVEPKIAVDPDLGLVEVDYVLSAYLDAADPLLNVNSGTEQAADAFVAATFLSGFATKTGTDRLKEFERSHSGWVSRNLKDLRRFIKASSDMIVAEMLPRLDNYRSLADYGRHALDRVARDEATPLSERTIVRVAALAAAMPDRFEESVRRELDACDVRIVAAETSVPPRPRQADIERKLRARIEAFADEFRQPKG